MNKNKTKQGAFRYSQTSFDRWLAPTNSNDLIKVEEALEKYKDDKWKALEYLVNS